MHSNSTLKTITALLSMSFLNTAMSSVTLPITENKRLSAPISASSMNRLAVANDRISHIFGDEGTFVTQADETTGQLFIKPTPENGTNPLSLTLITENGVTQDLTLTVAERSPSTIILKGSPAPKDHRAEVVLDKGLPIQESLISLMKRAILGQLTPVDLSEKPQRQLPQGCEVRYQRSYQAGPAFVHVYDVENTDDKAPFELQEKQFTQPGDLALCAKSSLLDPHTSTELYVVSRT